MVPMESKNEERFSGDHSECDVPKKTTNAQESNDSEKKNSFGNELVENVEENGANCCGHKCSTSSGPLPLPDVCTNKLAQLREDEIDNINSLGERGLKQSPSEAARPCSTFNNIDLVGPPEITTPDTYKNSNSSENEECDAASGVIRNGSNREKRIPSTGQLGLPRRRVDMVTWISQRSLTPSTENDPAGKSAYANTEEIGHGNTTQNTLRRMNEDSNALNEEYFDSSNSYSFQRNDVRDWDDEEVFAVEATTVTFNHDESERTRKVLKRERRILCLLIFTLVVASSLLTLNFTMQKPEVVMDTLTDEDNENEEEINGTNFSQGDVIAEFILNLRQRYESNSNSTTKETDNSTFLGVDDGRDALIQYEVEGSSSTNNRSPSIIMRENEPPQFFSMETLIPTIENTPPQIRLMETPIPTISQTPSYSPSISLTVSTSFPSCSENCVNLTNITTPAPTANQGSEVSNISLLSTLADILGEGIHELEVFFKAMECELGVIIRSLIRPFLPYNEDYDNNEPFSYDCKNKK